MKKLIFYSILVLVFLAACTPDSEETDNTQPEYPPGQEITKITVYLDGYEPPAQSRAINKDFAKMGCDYFEVIFLYNNNTVMGQWRIGEKAGVNGVIRGVNYRNVSSAPPSGEGSAILLAGKSDKTLMAIGRLSSGSTSITTTTTSVTFDVAAVKVGVNPDLTVSSFLTAGMGKPNYSTVADTNTETVYEDIESLYFLAFKLPGNVSSIQATYNFKLDASSVSFADYNNASGNAIYVSSSGTAYKKRPSYSMEEGGNINGGNSVPILDIRPETTVVNMGNNQRTSSAEVPFVPKVEFTFDTRGAELGSIFALVFQIPVYVLRPECGVWYIRPGYGVLNYELDNGTGGMGGAVLIKIGDAEEPKISSNEFYIKIIVRPDKWRYRWTGEKAGVTASTSEGSNPVEEYNRRFYIAGFNSFTNPQVPNVTGGLIVEKFDKATNAPVYDFDYPPTTAPLTIPTPPSGAPTGKTNVIPYNQLTFVIGGKDLPSNAPGNYDLPEEFYGLIEITVKHTNSGNISATDKFYILASGNYTHVKTYGGEPDYSTTAYDYANLTRLNAAVDGLANDTKIVSATNDLNEYFNADGVNRLQIVRLGGSFDIPGVTKNTDAGQSRLYMFVSVAANDNLVLGRSGTQSAGTQLEFNGDNSGLTAFYFGKWPFDGLRNSPAALNGTTREFKINAGGTYANPNNIVINTSRKMLVDGAVKKRWYLQC